jgi:phosphate transport system permease protein
VSRTSAAILVLLGFLVIMNMIAIVLRHRFERKW